MSNTAIVRAAVLIADEQGVDALTMRHLGAQLGAKAMALYRYVSGREDLLDAMVAATMDQLAPLLSCQSSPAPSGKDYLERTARKVRDLALHHRWLIRLMVARTPPHAWISPPLSGPACSTSVVESLTMHGYDLAASVEVYRDLCAFLLGHLLMEIPQTGDAPASHRAPDRASRGQPLRVDLSRSPLVSDHLTAITRTDLSAEFERCLSGFLRSTHPRTPGTVPTLHQEPTSG